MNYIKFVDTNILLSHLDWVNEQNFILLSSVTINELESIKTSETKSEQVKFQARKAVRWLNENQEKYEIIVYDKPIKNILNETGLECTKDNKIMSCAQYASERHGSVFATNDILAKLVAKTYFGLAVESINEDNKDEYKGYIEVKLEEQELAWFYEHLNENTYNLLPNQYIVLRNANDEIIDKLKWSGNEYQNIKFPTIKSNLFGNVKPYNGDIYQQMVLNCLSTNQVTMIKGSAGTGKSYLALGFLLFLLEKKKIDKIIVFCNTVATINSAKLGFYPGTKDEKLLDSAIGNMLSAKLGDSVGLEQLIGQGKIELLPMSDIRGYDTSGMNAGIYITEAQNMDISLMKLALQRIGNDCICIIDGDYTTQVDMAQYTGSNNGMRRMSEVFRGQSFYGEVELQNIYRSRISQVAESM